jgi:hypothetical protein
MKRILLIILFATFGCSKNFQTIMAETSKIGHQKGLEPIIYQTKNFKIFTLQKITDPLKPLKIYFEGDGRAFINRHTASANPTPTSFFLINLIKEDDSANILYVARPCQYVSSENCQPKYWTNARFSKEIIDAVDEVVKAFPKFELELVGYSGGGEVAKQIAVRNKNVVNLRTIAGNIYHAKFTEIHHVLPLDESLPEQNLLKLANIPQIHFVGSKDKVVPKIIAETYRDKLLKKSCARIILVENATHSKGWNEEWKKLSKIQPFCTSDEIKKPLAKIMPRPKRSEKI